MDRIDVLAQLRTTYCPRECYEAVAELIEADREYNRAENTAIGDGYSAQAMTAWEAAADRRNAALARIEAPTTRAQRD